MDFIRDALRGKLSTHRRPSPSPPSPEAPTRRPHALDALPRLPSPRRPLTPLPALPQHPASPFFALPAELRNQIYLLLLSNHTFHLDMRYSAVWTTIPHSVRGVRFGAPRAWRWRGCTCHRRPSSHPLADRCGWGGRDPPTACHLFPGSPCTIPREATGLLLCCRQAYREVLPVLYGANTLHVATGVVVLHTAALLPAAGRVRRLVYHVTDESAWEYAEEHLGIESGLGAYWTLMGRLPEAFPGLAALEVMVSGLFRVQGGSGRPVEAGEMRGCVLGAMDAVVRGFGGRLGEEGVLAMSGAAFDRLMEGEMERAGRVEAREGMWVQFWRPVSVVVGEETVETGYWVRRVAEETAQSELMDLQLDVLASLT